MTELQRLERQMATSLNGLFFKLDSETGKLICRRVASDYTPAMHLSNRTEKHGSLGGRNRAANCGAHEWTREQLEYVKRARINKHSQLQIAKHLGLEVTIVRAKCDAIKWGKA